MIITKEQLKDVTGCDYYDGSALHCRQAYKFFKKQVNPLGNIVAFVAPMVVEENLIDLEDSLNKDFIYSDSAMNFIMEIPNQKLWGGILFQRLLNAQVGSLLCGKYLQAGGFVDGDDIMVFVEGMDEPKKASVSIAAEKNNAVLIHLGINIKAGSRAPSFAYSTNLDEEQQKAFMEDVINIFYGILADVFTASTKIII